MNVITIENNTIKKKLISMWLIYELNLFMDSTLKFDSWLIVLQGSNLTYLNDN